MLKPVESENCLFVLYSDGQRWVLEVECGTTAVYSLRVELTAAEIEDYRQRGAVAVRQLALDVQTWPDRYANRQL